MKWLDDLQAIPPGSLGRRFLLAVLLAAGITMTAAGSMFWGMLGPIPFRFIPDVRYAVTILSGLFLGLYAAGGGAHRRKLALWGTVGYVLGFHLEEASVHWIGPFPGSITGTRVGILGTLGSLLALAAVLLMHVEVEHARTGRDLAQRGGDAGRAREVAETLRRVGMARVAGVAAGVAGIGVLVRAAEAIVGNGGGGGVYALFLGGGLLLALGFVLVRFAPARAAA